MKSISLLCLLSALSACASALKCPTCLNSDCQSEQIKELECLARTPILSDLKALQTAAAKGDGEFKCLALKHEAGEVRQCILVSHGVDLCENLKSEVKIEACGFNEIQRMVIDDVDPSSSTTIDPCLPTTVTTTTTTTDLSTTDGSRRYRREASSTEDPCTVSTPGKDSAAATSISVTLLIVALISYLF